MKFYLLLFTVIFYSVAGNSQPAIKNSAGSFKVVGYYFLRTAMADSLQALTDYSFLDKITHLNLAFINPDTAGNFSNYSAIAPFIKKAHNKNVKVLASIAGGGDHSYYAALLQKNKRKYFIANLVALAVDNNFDGIDVDLEGNDIDSDYTAFITDLSTALKLHHKLMTAAIATAYKNQLSDKALHQFDFVNIMSYDQTGPWSPTKKINHSPYSMAEEDLDYWGKVRLIPGKKMVLGLPFYGYGFSTKNDSVVSMDYNHIVLNDSAENYDQFNLPQKFCDVLQWRCHH